MLQGDQADCMYFIEHGKVRIVAKKKVAHLFMPLLCYFCYYQSRSLSGLGG